MKIKTLCAGLLAMIVLLFACAFTIDENSSIKELTHPYMNTYECTRATLGDADLLEEYEYFRIIIGENEKLEVLMKKKGEQEQSFASTYKFDEHTRELTAEIGILGFAYRQKTIIRNGKFVISMPVLAKQLVMIFEVK